MMLSSPRTSDDAAAAAAAPAVGAPNPAANAAGPVHHVDIVEDVIIIEDDDDDDSRVDTDTDCCDAKPSTMNEVRFRYAASLSERATEMLLISSTSTKNQPPPQPGCATAGSTSSSSSAGRRDEAAIEAFKEALCILKDLMLELDDIDGGSEDVAIVEDDDGDSCIDHAAIDDSIDDSIDEDNDDDTVLVQRQHQHGYSSNNSDDVIMGDASATDDVPPTTSTNDALRPSRTVPVRMTTHPFRQPTVSSSSASTAAAAASATSSNSVNRGGSLDTTDQIYIYKNLVRFCPSGNIKVDTNLLSATIIFNMALLYHHHGIVSSIPQSNTVGCCSASSQRSPPSPRRIHESDLSSLYGLCLQLYDMAVILVERILSSQEQHQQDGQDDDDCCEGECLFLRMVCLNNMAQAAYENREYAQSRHLLDVLQVSMREDEAVSKLFLDEASIHGIILNCILLHPPSAAEAA